MNEGNERLEDLVLLAMTNLVGIITYKRLLSHFGNSSAIMRASSRELEQVNGIGPIISKAIVDARRKDVQKELTVAEKLGIKILPYFSESYPKLLKMTFDYPLVLYIKGEYKSTDQLAIALVGSRKPTLYGKKQAERFGHEIASTGITVISGLARGVDTYAHRGALNVKEGRTIAILGSGLDWIYPPENKPLSERITKNGALITEFPFGTEPAAENFPRRNRIISGISLGVLVVEAGERSGALLTVDWALQQNKEVFALPGNIDSFASVGCNEILKQGAKLVTSINDILEEIPLLRPLLKEEKLPRLTFVERTILSNLSNKGRNLHELVEMTKISDDIITDGLEKLRIKGLISEIKKGVYIKFA
jgi:DNA processing protein